MDEPFVIVAGEVPPAPLIQASLFNLDNGIPSYTVCDGAAVRHADPLSANVYADWLEEHGEPAAAAKLRAAFPIGR